MLACRVKKRLPSGYTELEYIGSSGTQWIDTGTSTSNNGKMEITFQQTQIKELAIIGNGGIVGTNNILYSIRLGTSLEKISFNAYQTTFATTVNNDLNKHDVIIDMKNGSFTLDGVVYTKTRIAGTTSYGQSLFAYRKIAGYDHTFDFVGKIFEAKYYDDDVLLRDFIPAKRNSDNVLGMYDIVNDQFYTNAGSGSFTGGDEVLPILQPLQLARVKPRLPGEYQEIEYIEQNTTGQRIKLPACITDSDVVRLKFMTIGSGSVFAYSQGSSAENTVHQVAQASGSRNIILDIESYSPYRIETNVSALNTPREILVDKKKLYIDGVLKGTSRGSLAVPTGTLYLMSNASGANNCRLYYFKVDGKLDIIPCYKKSNNEYGMYDLVTKEFYGNDGTGSFTGGTAVSNYTLQPLTTNRVKLSRNILE